MILFFLLKRENDSKKLKTQVGSRKRELLVGRTNLVFPLITKLSLICFKNNENSLTVMCAIALNEMQEFRTGCSVFNAEDANYDQKSQNSLISN